MALTGWSLDNFLHRNAGVFTALTSENTNLLLSSWIWVPVASGSWPVIYLGIQGQTSNANSRNMGGVNDGGDTVATFGGKTNQDVTSSGGGALSTWHNISWVCIGNSLQEAWLNGGGKVSNANASSTASISDLTRIGRTQHTGVSGALAFQSAGAIAECTVWDVTGLSLANRDALAALLATAPTAPNPLAINAQTGQPWEDALLAYWRLTDSSDLADLAGNGHNLTPMGALSTFGSNPPVDPVPEVGGLLLLLHARGDD